MGILEILLTAVALSMDAFAVAICKGLAMKRLSVGKAVTVGVWFGVFQAAMPLVGYYIVELFKSNAAVGELIRTIDHWVAFFLLALIGANMIREAFSKKEEPTDCSLAFGKMLVLAVATSIDALAVGMAFAFKGLSIHIIPTVVIIGIVTFIISMLGVKIGNAFGSRYEKKAEFVGGCILVLLGLKTLIEGLIEGAAL